MFLVEVAINERLYEWAIAVQTQEITTQDQLRKEEQEKQEKEEKQVQAATSSTTVPARNNSHTNTKYADGVGGWVD